MRSKGLLILVLAAAVWFGPVGVYSNTGAPAAVAQAEKFYRTELYFGLSKPDGTDITDEEWRDFLKNVVTPRFPSGFTELAAKGQYRDKNERIILEKSRVLIFLYPRSARKTGNAKIEEIRAAYVKQFDQESVLRMDFSRPVNVSF